jgi:hypothetical protein
LDDLICQHGISLDHGQDGDSIPQEGDLHAIREELHECVMQDRVLRSVAE